MLMPWEEKDISEEKLKFINAWLTKEFNFSTLCKRYKISRPTGYELVERYQGEGVVALQERARGPHTIPHKTPENVERELLVWKQRYPHWGPRLIRDFLLKERAEQQWPAASTIGDIFKKHGLVKPRKYRKRVTAHSEPLKHCTGVNEVWSADFKGQFLLRNKHYCYPLTMTDNYSRYLILCKGLMSPNSKEVMKYYEKAFREYGLPERIRTDNGQPFVGLGIGGLTRLSIWLLKLGILPERIQPGCPQQNGRHERMHRTLKEAVVIPNSRTLEEQQKLFDEFMVEFNTQRPHQALQGNRPAEVHKTSPRLYPDKLSAVEYPETHIIRRVKTRGDIRFAGKQYFVSELLHGEAVGLERVDEDRLTVYFSRLRLGMLDVRSDAIIRP